jgi:hypothetical protein
MAQLAFLIASEDHQNEGSMGIKFDENQTIWKSEVDKETGEVLPSQLFTSMDVGEDNLKEEVLDRKKSETGVRLHRPFHRPNFYAQNYIPIFLGKDIESSEIKIRAGFSWENSVEIKTNGRTANKNILNILSILSFAKNKIFSNKNNTFDESNPDELLENLYNLFDKKIQCGNYRVFYIDWDKTKIHQYFVNEFSADKSKKWNNEVEFLTKLSYRVQKQKITKLQDIKDVLSNIEIGKTKNKKYFEINLFDGVIILPAKNEWQNLLNGCNQPEDFDKFLKNYFIKKNDQTIKHKKVRKVFSLPVVNTLGNFLQKRKSWNSQDIYQISPDSDSRSDGNKFSRLVLTDRGEIKEVINKPFESNNTFKLKYEELLIGNDYHDINPNECLFA